jgi:hypothetical protein
VLVTEVIVGIYGEIDRAVQLDPLARVRVSQLLPEYKVPGVRWYDDFLEWMDETRETPSPEEPKISERAFPDLTAALEAVTTDDLTDGRARARLLFATAAATRAFPEMKKPKTELGQVAVGALSKFGPEEDRDLAEELLKVLSDDRPEGFDIRQIPGTRRWWKGVARFLRERHIDTTGMAPMPCTARLVTVPGIDGLAAALRTEFDTRELDFEKATNFMAPVNWKTCRPDFWCVMEEEPDPKLPRGQCRYHEIVSSNCEPPPQPLFRAETRLLFNFMWIPAAGQDAQAAVANYELAEQPSGNDLIQVDEGSLVVSRLDRRTKPDEGSDLDEGSGQAGAEWLRITTTKRIRFNYPFSSRAIALFVCALGWLDTGARLVACAAEKGVGVGAVPFPGESATDALKPRTARAAGSAGSPPGSAAGPPGSLIDLCQEGVDIWARALRDGAAALERHGGGGPEGSQKRQHRPGS